MNSTHLLKEELGDLRQIIITCIKDAKVKTRFYAKSNTLKVDIYSKILANLTPRDLTLLLANLSYGPLSAWGTEITDLHIVITPLSPKKKKLEGIPILNALEENMLKQIIT